MVLKKFSSVDRENLRDLGSMCVYQVYLIYLDISQWVELRMHHKDDTLSEYSNCLKAGSGCCQDV